MKSTVFRIKNQALHYNSKNKGNKNNLQYNRILAKNMPLRMFSSFFCVDTSKKNFEHELRNH